MEELKAIMTVFQSIFNFIIQSTEGIKMVYEKIQRRKKIMIKKSKKKI